MHSGMFRLQFIIQPGSEEKSKVSNSVICCGIKWNLQVQYNIVQPYVYPGESSLYTVYLHAVKDGMPLDWNAEVEGSVTTINYEDSSYNLTTEFSTVLSDDNASITMQKECECEHCRVDDCCLYDEHGLVTIDVRIRVKKSVGISLPPTFDFSKSNEFNDVALALKDKCVYVNKQMITLLAPELGKLLQKPQVKLGWKYKTFVEFLNVLYPSQAPISYLNYESLLAIAKRYSIQSLTDRVEDWLVGERDYDDWDEGIKLAVKYGLKRFRDFLANMSRDHQLPLSLSQIKYMPEYAAMSDREAREFFEAIHFDSRKFTYAFPTFE